MIERLIFAVALAVAAWTAFRLLNMLLVHRAAERSLGLPAYRRGRPAIVYFKTEGCGPCESLQGPALAEIRRRLGDRIQIIEIDAAEQVELAKAWGVLTVPTTFLIDTLGRPRGVNQGAVGAAKLVAQLRPFVSSAAGAVEGSPLPGTESDPNRVNVE